LPSGQARYPQPSDPERSTTANLSESINFRRLEKIRTHVHYKIAMQNKREGL
jgi:hypothetical protein